MGILTRSGKGSPLTFGELDNNFTELNDGLANKVTKEDGKVLISSAKEVNIPANTIQELADKSPKSHGHTKADVGLANVDNTSDASKPVSTAQQSAITAARSGAVADIRNGVVVAGDDLNKLYNLFQSLNTLVTGTTPDGDAVVNTVQEVLAVMSTYPEGTDLLGALGDKVNVTDIVNTLTEVTSGKVLDARQGKILNDLINSLQISFDNHSHDTDAVTEGTTNKYFTEARVLASKLTGYVKAATVVGISATMNFMEAIGILERKLDDKVDKTTTLSINGTTLDLSQSRSFTITVPDSSLVEDSVTNGNITVDGEEIVVYNDSDVIKEGDERLLDARPPLAHNHPAIRKQFNKAGHGLTFGQFIKKDLTPAQANNAADSEIWGMVSQVIDVNNFLVTQSGWEDLSSLALTPGEYYLSPTVAGGITLTKPSSDGHIVRSVLKVDASGNGQVLNLMGYEIGVTEEPTVFPLSVDFFVSTSAEGSLLNYKTDTYRTIDLQPLTVITITNTNEIVRNGNDLFIVGNFTFDGTGNAIAIALYGCYIEKNILKFTSSSVQELTGFSSTHGLIFHRGSLFLSNRVYNYSTTSYDQPLKFTKINPYDLSDFKVYTLPNLPEFIGGSNDIVAYKDRLFVLINETNYANARLVSIDTDLTEHKLLKTLSTRVLSTAPMTLYNNELYIIGLASNYTITVNVFDLEGNLIRQAGITLPDNNASTAPQPHWVTVFNSKVLITTVYDSSLVRVDAKTLVHEETIALPGSVTDDNSVTRDGYIYLNSEYNATYSPNPKLLKVKYNDFTNLTIEQDSYGFNGKGSYGSINYIPEADSAEQNYSSIKKLFIKNAHGFTLGQFLKKDLTLAQANNAADSEIWGMVSEVIDSNSFKITQSGWEDLSSLALTPGEYYLSPTVAGGITLTKPNVIGHIVRSVLKVDASGNGQVLNLMGYEVGEIDENITQQGNTFNGPEQLVKIGADGKLPAVDGSLLTNLPSTGGGGSSNDYTIDPFTGEIVSWKTLDWADTVENDALADGVIIAKFGTVYKERVIPNGRYNIKWWGVTGKFEPVELNDGTITTGTNRTVTCPSASFTQDDVGKTIIVKKAGWKGYSLVDKIKTVVSATQITVELNNIQETVTNATVIYYKADTDAFAKAKAAVPAEGGTIYFPNGEYMSDKGGWQIYRHNLTIEGESKSGVILKVPSAGQSVGLDVAPYRTAGWAKEESDLVPFTETMDAGQGWVEPKDPADLSKYTIGEPIFICAGAAGYDQQFGEFNIVKEITDTKIYLKWNFGRSYNLGESNYSGTVLADFTPPAYNADRALRATATVLIDQSPKVGHIFAIGNDLYEVISKVDNSDQLEISSVKSTNSSAVVPAGTRCFEMRAIYRTLQTPVNTTVRNLSVYGTTNAVRVSNSVSSTFENVYFKFLDDEIGAGLWVDGDGGRDANFYKCTFECDRISTAQPARSFTDMKFIDCEFIQAGIHFSEFNQDCEISSSKLYLTFKNKFEKLSLQITHGSDVSGNVVVYLNGTEYPVAVVAGDTPVQVADKIRATAFTNWTIGGTSGTDTVTFTSTELGKKQASTYMQKDTGATGTMTTITVADKPFSPVSIGWTTSNIKIMENEFWVEGGGIIIDSGPDQVNSNNIWRGGIKVKDNTLHVKDATTILNITSGGSAEVSNNKMFGTTISIMNANGWDFTEGEHTIRTNGFFMMGSHVKVHNNTFIGYCDGLTNGTQISNSEWKDNYFHMLGLYTEGGEGIAGGNVIWGGKTTVDAEYLVFRDNVFKGWHYKNNSFNPNFVLNSRIDIANNHFIDQRGTDRIDKDFTISINDGDITEYGSIKHNALVKNADIDYECFLALMNNVGGSLSATEKTAIKKAIKNIYTYKLRDKIDYLNLIVGGANGSRVPIIGWHKLFYQKFILDGLTDSDYIATTGWKGNGTGGGVLLKDGEEIEDHTDFGLFVQVTDVGTRTTSDNYTLIGETPVTGGYSAVFSIYNDGYATLRGLGNSLIANSYNIENGFHFTSQKVSSQQDFLDTATFVDHSNTTAGNVISSGNIVKLLKGTKGVASDAGIGACGVTKYMTLEETKALRSIIGQLMLDLGRPAQRATFELPSALTENKGTSTQSGDGVLTAFNIAHGLSTIPSYYSVQPGSVDASGISYVTADATNLTVNYSAAPVAGTDNLKFVWNVNK